MAKLRDIAVAIRSANAGASLLTFDIMFGNKEIYETVREKKIINPKLIAKLYKISESSVIVYEYDPAHSFKITIPRPHMFGDFEETDFDGKQQHAPLLDIEIPL